MAIKIIAEQVHRIIDEGAGRTRQVIVRMKSVDKELPKVLRSASAQLVERRLALSAREIWTNAQERAKGRRSPTARRMGAQAKLPAVPRQRLISAGNKCGDPLRKSGIAAKYDEDSSRGILAWFSSSKSALMEMSPDELAALPDEVNEIADIYPNRTFRVPRFVEVTALPQNVEDNKASAWGIHAIGAMAVWGAFGARGAGVKVAVLDTGVDATHPDLAGKISDWAEFDGNGLQVPGSTAHDSDQHGTHVAGTIVGGDNSGRHIGVAPDARVAGGMVLTGGSGTDAQVLAGIDWALNLGVDAINMSLGGLTLGPDVPSTYTDAIVTCLRAGIPVVTAIGNEGSQTSGSPGNDLFAFAVGATDPQDRTAGFSGGRTQVISQSNFIQPDLLPLPYSKPDISAPGVAVQSSIPGGNWAAFNGTSMATPHVAGSIALLLSATKIRNNVNGVDRAFLIQDLLTGAVEELGEAGQDHRFGFGRLDILRTVGFAIDQGM